MGFAERRGAPGKEAAEGTEARDPGTSVETTAGEWARFRAYGNQMIQAHVKLRDMLDEMRDGVIPQRELPAHCLAFCDAVTRHHTGEDERVFPLLRARHPELGDFLAELERDHRVIAAMLTRLGSGTDRKEMDALAAVLETHFRGEEKRLAVLMNAVDPPELEGWDASS